MSEKTENFQTDTTAANPHLWEIKAMSHAGTYDDKSPEYQVRHWRNTPPETTDALDEFLGWYKDYLYDHDEDNFTVKSQEMERLISAFLEFSSEGVRAGEKSLLKKWTESALKP
jgi:hypothetical protein